MIPALVVVGGSIRNVVCRESNWFMGLGAEFHYRLSGLSGERAGADMSS